VTSGADHIQPREAISGRVALPFSSDVPDEIMWMPGGMHTITGSKRGRPITVTMRVDRAAADTMQRSLAEHLSGKQKPFFDFDHKGEAASAWPVGFSWRDKPEPGIYAKVQWSDAGRESIEGRRYRAFSPKWYETSDDPARVDGAPLNMGGLVNDPAFKEISPIWAKAADQQNKNDNSKDTPMTGTPTELAALQARVAELENQNQELKGKVDADDAETKSALEAAQAEADAAKKQVDDLKAQADERKRRDADACVASAVSRGAIAPKDETGQKRWRDLIISDPANAELLAKQPGRPAITAGRITRSHVEIIKPDISDAFRGYMSASTPLDRGRIYHKEFRETLEKGERLPVERASIEATDTLVGNLISQRTLDLVVSRRPMLMNVTTDFSAEQARLNQTIYTRTISIPTVYDFAHGAATPAATDVTVQLANHKEVHFSFAASDYLATNRDLIKENAEAMGAAIGNSMVDAVQALMTDAYNVITEITGAASAKDFTAITSAAKGLNTAGAPDFGRSMWVNADFAEALSNDELIMQFLDGNNRTAYGHWKNIKGFENIWEYPAFAANSINLIGFAFQRSALVLATRIADSPDRLVGTQYPGTLQVISDPVTGFSLLSDRWITVGTRAINTRLDVLYGCARGSLSCGVKFVTS